MKTLCLVIFKKEFDPYVNLTLELLASEPIINRELSSGEVTITSFKTELTIEQCKNAIQKCGHLFILLETTSQSKSFQASDNEEFLELLGVQKIDLILTDDDKESRIFNKIKNQGTESLSNEEHEFMLSRMQTPKY